MTTDKPTTWPSGRAPLEATSCQLGRCSHCGGFVVMFEAAGGMIFALAHLGGDAAVVKKWLAVGLEAAQ
jgi:hypothetical protein